eukprot:COSAG04_NODE_6146_length_1397_cov_1.386749_1_plen_76_part_10
MDRRHSETAEAARKGVHYTHAIHHPVDPSKVLACGSDRQVRVLREGRTIEEKDVAGGDVVQIALSSRGTYLFTALA